MRIGHNPAKTLEKTQKPAEITVAITVHIPFMTGYFKQSLDVFKLCLESLSAHTDLPYDLLIFDNASCDGVRNFLRELQREGKIQYLILSEKNMGVVGAWNVIFGAAPGKYIAYSDYDIYFYPNWLSALIELLETFPEAGMVTGLPLLTPMKFSSSTIEWAEKTSDAVLDSGQMISWENFWRHCQAIGSSRDEGQEFFQNNQSLQINYHGKHCFVGAGHFQFVGRKEYFQKITPLYAERPMGSEVRNLDIAINRQGYLRLCTPQWYVEHMGNVVQEKFILQDGNRSALAQVKDAGESKRKWIVQNDFIRRILESVYERIFRLLYEG